MSHLSLIQPAYTAELAERLDAAAVLASPEAITHAVKDCLIELLGERRLHIPDAFKAPRAESYARRLLLENRELGYQAIVMVWGIGQGTMLHDHAGIWCVEGVVEGEIVVQQYDLEETTPGDDPAATRYRFSHQGRIQAGVGTAGTLIPPFEYHTIANALPDRPAVTLHVYGGAMTHCGVYAPLGDDWYRREERQLSFS
jgi:predicted metal-dependent enzyme (double-stranded beta helix superfamily)